MLTLFSSARPDIPASPVLAIVLGLIFVAVVFFNSYRGYWRGPIRQVAPLIAFIVAGTLAWFVGIPLGYSFLGKLGVPWVLRGACGVLIVGSVVWLAVFSFLWMLGKKHISETTGEPQLPVLGATVGCWTGGFWVFVLVFVIMTLGSFGEARMQRMKNPEDSIFGKICIVMARTKKSVAIVPGFYFAESWCVVPSDTLRKFNKFTDVLSSRQARRRFFLMPEIRSISTLPSVYPVLNDKDIQDMINAKKIDALLSDVRINRMFDDEDFHRAISDIDIEAALDYALSEENQSESSANK